MFDSQKILRNDKKRKKEKKKNDFLIFDCPIKNIKNK